MSPHIAVWQFVPIVALLTIWRGPAWVEKVLAAAEAVERFRRRRLVPDQTRMGEAGRRNRGKRLS